jgi:hypothetical protein
MMKRSIAALVGTASLAALLMSTSLPSCGCADPWMSFLYAFGIEDATKDKLDAEILQRSAQRSLVGQQLEVLSFSGKIAPESCRVASKVEYDCEFWFIKGPIRERGFAVRAAADEQGRITRVRVAGLDRVFGVRF